MSQSLKSRRATSDNIKEVNLLVARQLFCRTKEEFLTQLINCLLTGYPVRTEKYQTLSQVARTSLRSVRTM